ncbi:MAG TPA: response regulator transcription factor [Oculatellaceae cyanobacterium]
MRANTVSSVLVAVTDQLRRTRIKHTLELINSAHVIGDSVNVSALLQQCTQRQPDIVVLDLDISEAELLELASQIQTRSPQTKIILLDRECKSKDLMTWAARGILAYASSEMDAHILELAISTVVANSIWIGAKLAKCNETILEAPALQAAALKSKSIDGALLSTLSEREKEVLRLLVAGHKNFAIAQALAISPETIKSHMRRIMEKLSVRDRTQLVIKVLQQGAA